MWYFIYMGNVITKNCFSCLHNSYVCVSTEILYTAMAVTDITLAMFVMMLYHPSTCLTATFLIIFSWLSVCREWNHSPLLASYIHWVWGNISSFFRLRK